MREMMAWHPDISLHGNGVDCPACALRREAEDAGVIRRARWSRCQLCDGRGRLPRPVGDIIADHVAEARQLHWPDFEARCTADKLRRFQNPPRPTTLPGNPPDPRKPVEQPVKSPFDPGSGHEF